MVDFADEQQADANYMCAMAADAVGFDVDDRNTATTPEEMTALIQAKLRSDIEATAEFAHRQVDLKGSTMKFSTSRNRSLR